MKWFKHESDDRNKIVSKLIRSQFGAEGYGIFTALQEVVAEYVDEDTFDDWGHVNPLHTIDTLSAECATTPEKLREFLAFCNDKKIIYKDNGCLYYPDIQKRLNDFASRIGRKFEVSSKSVRSQSVVEEKRREEKKKEEKRKEEIRSVADATGNGYLQAKAKAEELRRGL